VNLDLLAVGVWSFRENLGRVVLLDEKKNFVSSALLTAPGVW
jgi:hypothetical protein